MPALVVTGGPREGSRFELGEGEAIVGREEAAITIEDVELSRRHAVVRVDGDRVEIEDLGSLNGTFVGGERITGAHALSGGDTVRLGATTLTVELRSSATVVSPPRAPAAPPTRIAPGPPPSAPAPAALPMAAGPREAPAEPFGHYAAQTGGRAPIASRRLTPQLFTTACIVGTAIALVLYFAQH